jgi:serine/threonine protein kinase
MSLEFHKRARQLFEEALERPEAERRLFLKGACGTDPSLYGAVERLLAAHDSSSTFLETGSRPAKRIGRYEIRGELGRGAMGVVYEALDPLIGRSVAVKVIHLEAFNDPREAGFLTERLFREARSAGQLFHPGIVVILDVGKEGDTAFIAMERVEGMSLQQTLALGRLSIGEALGILRQTAAALDYAHEHGVVHRDIKPGNILLHHGSMVKVADFGIAKVMSPQATMTGVVMGTPSYMSPEQIQAQTVDGRADQFSLAVLAYELLTGARPFQGDSLPTLAHTIVYGPRPSAHGANPALAAGGDDVFGRGLAKLPEERYPSCAEFVAALESALTHPPPLAIALPPALPMALPIALPTDKLATPLIEKHPIEKLDTEKPEKPPLQEPEEPEEPEKEIVKKRTSNLALYLAAAGGVLVVAVLAAGFLYYWNNQRRPTPEAPRMGTPSATSVKEAPVNPVIQFAADPVSIDAGASAKLSWDVSGANEVVIDNGVGKVGGTGTFFVAPSVSTTYVLTATGAGAGTLAHATVSIEVKSKPAPVPAAVSKAVAPAVSAAARARQLYEAAIEKRRGGLPGAQDLFRQAANLGEPRAMLQMGEDYSDGQDVTKDEKEAARWFRLSADAGNTSGMVFLGAMYSMGEGVDKSDQEAAKWFEKAANAGNPAGLYNLAGMYERGQGVAYSLDKAKELYRKSAALGNAEAQRRLVELGK